MNLERRKISYLLIAVAGTMLLLFIDFLGFFEGIDSFFLDLSFRLRGSRGTDGRIVIAGIDGKTLEKLGRWPIRRTYYAEALNNLQEAAVVGFDIIMAEQSEDDAVLADAVRKHGQVVLAAYVSPDHLAVTDPSRTLLPAATGHIHVEQDIDGVVRKVFHSLYRDSRQVPSMASVMYESATGEKYSRRPLSPELQTHLSAGAIVQNDPMEINYYGDPRSFRFISFADIVSGAYPARFFKGKAVLVGVTATGLPTTVLTPFSGDRNRMTEVELQATILNNLLDGSGIRVLPDPIARLVAAMLSALCFVLPMKHRRIRAMVICLSGLTLVMLAVFGCFSVFNAWAGPALPCASVIFACTMSHLFRLDTMACKLDRHYASIASHLGLEPGSRRPHSGFTGYMLEEGLERKTEMLVRVVEELLRTCRALENETAERMRAMDELRQKEQMLIHQSRMAAMGEMLNNVAHQWRQPLNVLGLTIQQLGVFSETGKLDKELLDTAIANAMDILLHLSRTIDDFRNLSAPDKQKSLFRVDHAVARTVSLIEEALKDQSISLELEAFGEPQIDGYPHEFGQVIINILANARDAIVERGTSNPRITVRTWMENGKAVVTIADNAGGIEGEIMDKIFDPYFTTKELGKGTGVGLFMSKTIIEKNMGGRLTARNTANGVEFRIEV